MYTIVCQNHKYHILNYTLALLINKVLPLEHVTVLVYGRYVWVTAYRIPYKRSVPVHFFNLFFYLLIFHCIFSFLPFF